MRTTTMQRSSRMYNFNNMTRPVGTAASKTRVQIPIVMELEFDNSRTFGTEYLRMLLRMPWATSAHKDLYNKELLRREMDEAVVEPQFFDMKAIVGRIMDGAADMLDEVTIFLAEHPALYSVVFWAIFVFLYFKYLRKMSFSKQIIFGVVSMMADALMAKVIMAMAERLLKRVPEKLAKSIREGRDGDAERIIKRFFGDSALSVTMMDQLKKLRADTLAADVVKALYRVEHPDDEDEIMEATLPLLDEVEYVEPQMGVESLLIAAATKVLFRKIPLYRLVVDHDKINKGLGAMIAGATGSLEMVVNTLLKAFGKRPIVLLRAHEKVVDDWEKAVRVFVDSVRTGARVASTAQAQMEYDRYRDQGLTMEATYKDAKAKAVIKRGMDSLISVACHFAVRSNCTARMEPLVVCLTGGAGVGKTTLARMVAASMAKHICSPEEIEAVGGDLTRLAFQKGTSEYWEGYCGQPITVMDDWLQGIPQPGVDNEVVNLIRAANQWPYPLNMAALELKGKVNFSSRALLITTNVKNSFYISKVVASPAAVARRLDLTYDVRVSAEYSVDGKLDVAKLSAIQPVSMACYDKVWEFVPHNMETGQSGEGSIKLTDLIRRMHASYDRRVTAEDSTRGMVNGFADLPLYVEPQIGFRAIALGVSGVAACGVGHCVHKVARTVGTTVHAARKAIGAVGAVAHRVKATVEGVASNPGVRAVGAGLAIWLGSTLIRKMSLAVVAFVRVLASSLKAILKALGLWSVRKRVTAEAGALTPEAIAFQRNVIPIHMTKRGGSHTFVCGYGVMLDGRHMLLPYHFIREQRAGLCSLRAGFRLEGLVDISTCTSVLEAPRQSAGIRDMAIIRFDKLMRGYRDIRGHFRSFKESHNPEPGWMMGSQEVVSTGIGGPICSREYTNMQMGRVALTMHSAHTTKGDCGSLIVAANPAATRKIRGIHVAGDGTGYFCPVFAEDMPSDDDEGVEAEAFEGFDIVAEVPPIYNNGKTGIVPTVYSGHAVEPKGAPAHLRPAYNKDGVRVDPMVAVVETSLVDFDSITLPDTMELCVDAVVSEIMQDIGNADLSPLTYNEAVAGIIGDPFLKGLARGKSMGYPLARKYANKRAAFGAEGPYVFDTVAAKEVAAEYEKLVAAYNKGEQGAVFRDCLKDEVLKFEKVDAIKTRLISASPVQFTILVKELYGRFAAEFMRTRLKHGGLVGVNAYSPEWGIVRHELAKMNEGGLAAAGDYKAFDKSQHPAVMSAILRGIAKRLPHYVQHKALFDGIERDTCNALHLGGDSYRSWMIYRVTGTLPSGHPLTSILNSIYNMVVFRMAWVAKYGRQSVTAFRRKVRLYTYGDDNVFAPADDVIGFNLTTMSEFCGTIGMVYTSEDKTSDLYTLKPVGACGFLKRGFALDSDGYTYAPLEWYSIWDMLNWRKKKTTDDEHLAEVAVCIVRELSAYDFGRFAEGLSTLRELLVARGVEDPTCGMSEEFAYEIARGWYRGFSPVWSIED